MSNTDNSYERLEQRFAAWAAADPRVLALLVVGSRARQPLPGPLSDLDLVAFVTERERLLIDISWLREIGELWLNFRSVTGRGDPELFCLFAGALKVDVVFEHAESALRTTAEDFLPSLIAASSYGFVLEYGWRSLHPSNTQHAATSSPATHPLPDNGPFQHATSRMLFAATQVVKLLQRGEHWRARQVLDCEMHDLLFEMISWYSAATQPAASTPWASARGLHQWAPSHIHERLVLAVAGPTPDDILTASLYAIALFRDLARQLAAELGFTYPQYEDESVCRWLASQAPAAASLLA